MLESLLITHVWCDTAKATWLVFPPSLTPFLPAPSSVLMEMGGGDQEAPLSLGKGNQALESANGGDRGVLAR